MADREPPTLGRLKRLGVQQIRVVCLNCPHTAELDVTELVMTIGLGRRVDNLRFRCKACGGKRTQIRVLSETESPNPMLGHSWPR